MTAFAAGFFLTSLAVPALFAQIEKVSGAERRLNDDEIKAEQIAASWDESSYQQAIDLYEKAARQWLVQKNLSRYSDCLRKAARLRISLNEMNEARLLLDKSLVAEKKLRNAPGEVETLSILTIVALWSEDLKTAEKFYKSTETLAKAVKDPAVLAEADFAAAEFHYRNQRNLQLMTEFQEAALRRFREAGDRRGEARVLTELAYTKVMNNDRISGQKHAAEAVEIARRERDRRTLAFALIAMGDAFQRMGIWQEAYAAFKEAESIFPQNLDFPQKAILFSRFAFYYETFGDLTQARNYYQKARELYVKTGNLFGSSEAATVIGQISWQLGEKETALTNFREGLEVAVKLNDRTTLAYSYENLGEFYLSNKEHDRAREYLEKALKNYESVGIKYASASVIEKMGMLQADLGDNRSAADLFNKALAINRQINSRVGEADNLYRLALLRKSENDFEESLRNIRDCLRLTELLHGETANDKLRRSFLSEMFNRYELYINLLMNLHRSDPGKNYAIEALKVHEGARARSILENLRLANANFTKDADPEIIGRENDLRSELNLKSDLMTNLLSQKDADRSEIEKLREEINSLQNRLAEIKAELKLKSPIYSAIKNPAPFDINEFRNQILDDDSLLLEFSFGDEESYLWMISRTGVNAYVLAPRREIESKIAVLRELLASREKKPDESIEDYQKRIIQAERDFQTQAAALSEQLFGQAAGEFANKRLIVVPDGKLHYFPISALPAPGSTAYEPLLLTNEIVYEPSASTLALLVKSAERSPSGEKKNLLVFSDPVFSKQDDRFRSMIDSGDTANSVSLPGEKYRFAESLNSLVRLSGSKDEAESIAKIAGASYSDVLSGFSANRERFLNAEFDKYRIIHFATHGLVDENHPELSGIVLSRFNETGERLNEFVRLQDIYGLNLNSDLVVLSACNTGVGKEIKGEGLSSLNIAFLQVGAKTVVSSLWKVEDGATIELMTNFYDFLKNENLSTSKALQKAQIKMYQSGMYRSPFYWASFTAHGDFKRAPRFAGGWLDRSYLLYSLIVLIPAAIYGFWRFRKKAEIRKI